jgi:hypothetical protein
VTTNALEEKRKCFALCFSVFQLFLQKYKKLNNKVSRKLDVKFRLDKSGTSDEKMHKKFENFLKDFDLDEQRRRLKKG